MVLLDFQAQSHFYLLPYVYGKLASEEKLIMIRPFSFLFFSYEYFFKWLGNCPWFDYYYGAAKKAIRTFFPTLEVRRSFYKNK